MSDQTVAITINSIPGILPASAMAQSLMSSIRAQNDKANQDALNVYNAAVAQWLANAVHDRDLGQAIPPRPQQPTGTSVAFTPSGSADAITLTVTYGPVLLGTPCPDLPPTGATDGFVLGPAQGSGWFLVGPGDKITVGATVNTPDGHQYVKYQFFTGQQMYFMTK